MNLKYPCLIVDHDDTVVNSTATVHFPCFVEYMNLYRPDYRCTLEHYFLRNVDPGVVPFFRDEVGLSEEEMVHEQAWWNAYVQRHVPEVYPGMADILWRQKREGGLLCVISHSYRDNILRDYRENGLPEPDAVYGWECPPHLRKPNRRSGFRRRRLGQRHRRDRALHARELPVLFQDRRGVRKLAV